ncbi:MAG: glycoside hydrolase family 2 TIM barrel-domain containing protein [Xanthomonadales bacterium]
MKSRIIRALAAAGLAAASLATPALAEQGAIPVEIVESDGAFRLLRGGEPYEIHGAGLEFADIAVFASHGGNSFRTWRTDNAAELLDTALAHGVTILMCIEIGRERHGFDYDDEAAVAAQLEFARQEVLKYKDHPALLGWIIGNEPNLNFRNPKVFDAINDISKMIHEVDPNHPTTTALAGISEELAELIETRAPDLDFLSIQMYGDIVNLPRYVRKIGLKGPYMVTEWGAIGHWEVGTTKWGAPIEQNSSDKAANYRKSWNVAIDSDPDQIIGSYVFLWGQKQERTPTWYGMLLADGSKTETIDVMQKIWTGSWPENRAPQVRSMRLDGKDAKDNVTLDAGAEYTAQVSASDPEGDELTFRWEVMRESQATQTGGDKEAIPETLDDAIVAVTGQKATVRAPAEPGAYRLFMYVYDGNGSAGHANIPFRVR